MHHYPIKTKSKQNIWNILTNLDDDKEILINKEGVFSLDRNRDERESNEKKNEQQENQARLNEIVDAQVEHTEKVYSSVQIQFVLFLLQH